jgi:hypothetical protein
MILSKAASTPVEGAIDPPAELRFVDGLGAGVAVELEDFVAVFGVGDGFGATVRVRLEGEVVLELLFCAQVTDALATTIDAMTRDLFIICISSERLATEAPRHRDQRKNSVSFLCVSASLWLTLEFIPWTLAA